MKILRCFLFVAGFLALGCSEYGNSTSSKALHSYRETPGFIRVFLDSVYGGDFRVAEKGSRWNSGCVLSGDLPCRQFVSAAIKQDQYSLEFLVGGFVSSWRFIVINFKDEKVLNYSTGIVQNDARRQKKK